MVTYGYGKVLDVDLSTENIVKREVDPEFACKYVGGMGFSCKILYDQVGPNKGGYRFPERFYTEPLPDGPTKGAVLQKKTMDQLLDEYYELRGWNKSGLPTKKKLEALGLDDIAEDLMNRNMLAID